MRHVPLAEFQANATALLEAAQAGEEIMITRDGRDVLRLSAVEDVAARRRAALAGLERLRAELAAKGVRVTGEEVREWIDEGRP